MNRILLAAATAATFALVSQALADDGIAASPKARQMLNDRNATANAATTVTAGASYEVATPGANATASPKVRQMFADQAKSTLASSGDTLVSRADGIAASPIIHLKIRPTGQKGLTTKWGRYALYLLVLAPRWLNDPAGILVNQAHMLE